MTEKAFPTAPAHLKGSKPSRGDRLPFTKDAVTHTVKALTKELTFLCPITGLVVPTGLPAFPGIVFEAYHPIAHNGLSMLSLAPAYLENLPKPTLCAIFLSAMATLKKVELDGSALLINTAMQAALTKKQLLTSLEFIESAILRTKKGYPPIRLSAGLNEDTFNDYFNACVTLENWTPLPSDSPSVSIKSPAFLSSTTQAKALDKACYEAWLEVATYLPKATVEKAAPYVKTLASTPADGIINRLVAKVIEYTDADEYFRTKDGQIVLEGGIERTLETNREYAAAMAAYEFRDTVTGNRRTAAGLGLHRDLFDDAPLALPTDYDLPKVEANPYAELIELEAPTTPLVVEAKALSFSERMKARKAQGGAK